MMSVAKKILPKMYFSKYMYCTQIPTLLTLNYGQNQNPELCTVRIPYHTMNHCIFNNQSHQYNTMTYYYIVILKKKKRGGGGGNSQ